MKKIKAPFISVVLTTHKRPNLLMRALKSLIKQEFKDFEIILCADESEKETKKIATNFLRSGDVFVSSPHLSGPSESRNFGILLSKGEWICFLDDDDTFDETYFEKISQLIKEPNRIYYSNYTRIFESRGDRSITFNKQENINISSIPSNNLLISNFIPINAVFIPKNIAKLQNFDLNLQTHEDWDYYIALKNSGYEFEGLDNIYGPNVHLGDEVSRNKSKAIPLDYLSIYRKWPSSDEALRKVRANILAESGVNIPENFL